MITVFQIFAVATLTLSAETRTLPEVSQFPVIESESVVIRPKGICDTVDRGYLFTTDEGEVIRSDGSGHIVWRHVLPSMAHLNPKFYPFWLPGGMAYSPVRLDDHLYLIPTSTKDDDIMANFFDEAGNAKSSIRLFTSTEEHWFNHASYIANAKLPNGGTVLCWIALKLPPKQANGIRSGKDDAYYFIQYITAGGGLGQVKMYPAIIQSAIQGSFFIQPTSDGLVIVASNGSQSEVTTLHADGALEGRTTLPGFYIPVMQQALGSNIELLSNRRGEEKALTLLVLGRQLESIGPALRIIDGFYSMGFALRRKDGVLLMEGNRENSAGSISPYFVCADSSNTHSRAVLLSCGSGYYDMIAQVCAPDVNGEHILLVRPAVPQQAKGSTQLKGAFVTVVGVR